MATAAPPQVPAQFETGIREPLLRLRRAIRAYIVMEGAARIIIWTCLWCWATFLLDWSLFQVLNVDYVRDGSQGVRNLWRGVFIPVLVVGLGIILYQVISRLLTALREPALALVLERHFPGILGDRLVTAVELADEARANRYGYSWPMVEETQHGAATRLAELDVRHVLNRRRQFKEGSVAVMLALGLVALAIFATDVATVWFERDVMLEHRFWPRQTILQLVNFPHAVPHGGEAKIDMKAWKWVVATDTNAEGWRPLEWEDLLPSAFLEHRWSIHPFQGSEMGFDRVYWDALPAEWRALTPDQIESRIQPESLPRYRRELGLAVVQAASKRPDAAVDAHQWKRRIRTLLPSDWAKLPFGDEQTGSSLSTVQDYLKLSERLTPGEQQRLIGLVEGNQISPIDAALMANSAISRFRAPVLDLAAWQRLLMAADPRLLPMTLSDSDRELLPLDWHELPAKALVARLREFPTAESPEAIGDLMAFQLRALFDKLDGRAQEHAFGRRRIFRKLLVPEDVTVEFEQVLTDEERQRTKPKVGTPKVRRSPENLEFTYEFKKVERPLRFRVVAGDMSTAWAQIQVKPIPTMKQLTRYQEELGYLHGSNERVHTGPFAVSLEGSESRFDVPSGTLLRFDGECYKDLRSVRIVADGLVRPDNVNVKLDPEGKTFHFAIGELPVGEQRLRLELEDNDGIPGKRELVVNVVADKAPEFQNTHFDIVNHKLITQQAVIPFSGQIRDDHGLREAWFEVTVEKEQKLIAKKRLPMLRFQPLVSADPAAVRFEKYEDVTPGRLMMGPVAEHTLAALGVSRSPTAGLLAWLPPIFGDVPKMYVFQYRERSGSGPVLGAEDEYVDTLLLRPPEATGGATSNPEARWPAPPYRLRIAVIAKDNRVVSDNTGHAIPAGQESANPETFEFTVVDEADLLIDAGKREEDLRDRCEEVIGNLKKARTALQRLHDDFPTYQDENEFRRAVADGQDMAKALRAARDGVDQRVLHEFRQIYRELALNRCRADVLDRIDQKICRPLEAILQPGQHFERADEALDALIRAMESERAKAPRGLFSVSVEQTDRLISRLDEILLEMKKLIEFNQALGVLREIIKNEERILKQIEQKYKEQRQKELQDK